MEIEQVRRFLNGCVTNVGLCRIVSVFQTWDAWDAWDDYSSPSLLNENLQGTPCVQGPDQRSSAILPKNWTRALKTGDVSLSVTWWFVSWPLLAHKKSQLCHFWPTPRVLCATDGRRRRRCWPSWKKLGCPVTRRFWRHECGARGVGTNDSSWSCGKRSCKQKNCCGAVSSAVNSMPLEWSYCNYLVRPSGGGDKPDRRLHHPDDQKASEGGTRSGDQCVPWKMQRGIGYTECVGDVLLHGCDRKSRALNSKAVTCGDLLCECIHELLAPAVFLQSFAEQPNRVLRRAVMDVTVSIHDWKSLSQSEIIVRHLYAILQPLGPGVGHKQYFLTYLAQGLGRVGKEYLKTSAASVLTTMSEMQIFSNLLPEFGSLPWALKPLLVLLIERSCSAKARQQLLAAAAIITGLTWLFLSWGGKDGTVLLFATALVSLGSAVVDGLTDGLISAESTEASAVELQSLCQTGHSIGALLVGIAAWVLTLPDWLALTCTALAWAVIAPFALKALIVTEKAKKQASSLSTLVLQRDAALVSIVGFAVCLAPPGDVFLYRKHVLGLQGFQQPIISIAGTVGWFLCTVIYRKQISAGRRATDSLRLCLKLWAVPLVAKTLILRPPEMLVLPAALLENAAHEFGKALTFLPVTVLQQLHAPAGCEGSAFTLMQAGGTLGMVFGRNLEWQLLRWCGVDMQLGADGFTNFSVLLAIVGAWRVLTASGLCFILLPLLDETSEKKSSQRTVSS
eukprot:s4991_g1.t4